MRMSTVKMMPSTSITASPVLPGFFTCMGTMNIAPLTSSSSVYATGIAPPKSPRKQYSSGTDSADEVIGTPR